MLMVVMTRQVQVKVKCKFLLMTESCCTANAAAAKVFSSTVKKMNDIHAPPRFVALKTRVNVACACVSRYKYEAH